MQQRLAHPYTTPLVIRPPRYYMLDTDNPFIYHAHGLSDVRYQDTWPVPLPTHIIRPRAMRLSQRENSRYTSHLTPLKTEHRIKKPPHLQTRSTPTPRGPLPEKRLHKKAESQPAVDRYSPPSEHPPLRACRWRDCSQKGFTTAELKIHLLKEHVDGPKGPSKACYWNQCSSYGKAFSKLCGLLSHVRYHNGQIPYKCHIKKCPKGFYRRFQLEKHLCSHREKAVPLICPYLSCSALTHSPKEFVLHIEVEHEDDWDLVPKRKSLHSNTCSMPGEKKKAVERRRLLKEKGGDV
ncbi:hypothetical protein BDF14DRAFT_207121 [Spinellus fusiger]|nr:hypothetical protein BDF14DRAFT_207121 [Spinellus fusiger]